MIKSTISKKEVEINEALRDKDLKTKQKLQEINKKRIKLKKLQQERIESE